MLGRITPILGFIQRFYNYGDNLMRSYSAPWKSGCRRCVLREHEVASRRLGAAAMASQQLKGKSQQSHLCWRLSQDPPTTESQGVKDGVRTVNSTNCVTGPRIPFERHNSLHPHGLKNKYQLRASNRDQIPNFCKYQVQNCSISRFHIVPMYTNIKYFSESHNIYYYLCKHKCNRVFGAKYNNDTSYSETTSNMHRYLHR